MSKAGKRRARRVRRQMNAAMKFGWKAKPTHKGKSGRTGGMHHKMLQNAMRGKGMAARVATKVAKEAGAVICAFDDE